MKRKIDEHLVAWKNSPDRKPLVLNGARQIGKSHSLRSFGHLNYDNVVEVNMEMNKSISDFIQGDLTPIRIIQFLELQAGQRILPEKTLIIFDEVQACPRALTALKYFYEQAPEYHLVAAGSLLGVAINGDHFSFPVGKVHQLKMYPMDFQEFLWACGKEALAEKIQHHHALLSPMPAAYHALALELYFQYIIVGGMPEVVGKFLEHNSYLVVQQAQHRLLTEYVADMAKYAPAATSVKIRACFDSIPTQLAKENTKFQYKVVQRGGSASLFGEAIDWLASAGIVLKCQNLEHGFIPLKSYLNPSNFKLYMGDIGLLTCQAGMPIQALMEEQPINNRFLGAMAENYVAQTLSSQGLPLLYWHSNGIAEIDFVLQRGMHAIPIEVKHGTNVRSKSLSVFTQRYKSPYVIRISQKNFGIENGIHSIPLYAAVFIGRESDSFLR